MDGVGVALVAVGEGVALALRAGVALGEGLAEDDTPAVDAEADAVRADGDTTAAAADFGDAATDAPLGLSPGDGDCDRDCDDSPADCFVRFCSPCAPSDEEEKAAPAISAATDAAPTAPTATATCFARRPPAPRSARRRSARPGPGTATAAPAAIRGSSRVSSYALSQPCAVAGSRYPSYTGAGSPWGW
ncbi:hypothetical protein [Streptomyces sp. NPDC048277]|uniref:hypothetical protein n=1 Tax=Streptomyces sp. NPDC048277 TaxID=3155027 RepID=UPI0033F5F16A